MENVNNKPDEKPQTRKTFMAQEAGQEEGGGSNGQRLQTREPQNNGYPAESRQAETAMSRSLHVNAHKSCICSSPKLESAQMSFRW